MARHSGGPPLPRVTPSAAAHSGGRHRSLSGAVPPDAAALPREERPWTCSSTCSPPSPREATRARSHCCAGRAPTTSRCCAARPTPSAGWPTSRCRPGRQGRPGPARSPSCHTGRSSSAASPASTTRHRWSASRSPGTSGCRCPPRWPPCPTRPSPPPAGASTSATTSTPRRSAPCCATRSAAARARTSSSTAPTPRPSSDRRWRPGSPRCAGCSPANAARTGRSWSTPERGSWSAPPRNVTSASTTGW